MRLRFIIQSGTVAVSQGASEINTLSDGSFFGENAVLGISSKGFHYPETYTAQTGCELYYIHRTILSEYQICM